MYTIPKGSDITPDLVKKAILHNEIFRKDYDRLDRYYNGFHDIFSRTKDGQLKNTQVMSNFCKLITRTNTGYLLGNPVEYQSKNKKVKLDKVLNQYKRQRIQNIDSELGKENSKFGSVYEYIYLDGNDVKSKVIDPRNCVMIYDDTMVHKLLAAVIYPEPTIGVGHTIENPNVICKGTMLVDSVNITTFNDDLTKNDTVTKHKLGNIPVIKYKNNSEEEGDYAQVISLQDAYNILESDRINDKIQLVESLLFFYGFSLDEKQVDTLKNKLVASVPDPDARAEYLSKQLQEEGIEILRKAIKEDIHKISMTPDFADENFAGGTASGIAIRYKLIGFELNTVDKEKYFEEGLMKRYEIYNAYLAKIKDDTLAAITDIDVVFKRKLPQNDLETAQMLSLLSGLVSDETRLSQLSFIGDAKAELAQAKKDALERAQTMAQEFGTTTPSGQADKNKPTSQTSSNKPVDTNTNSKK